MSKERVQEAVKAAFQAVLMSQRIFDGKAEEEALDGDETQDIVDKLLSKLDDYYANLKGE